MNSRRGGVVIPADALSSWKNKQIVRLFWGLIIFKSSHSIAHHYNIRSGSKTFAVEQQNMVCMLPATKQKTIISAQRLAP